MKPTNLRLPSQLIPNLQNPMGTFIKVEDNLPAPETRVAKILAGEHTKGKLIICVGDYVAKSLVKEHFIPDLIIIDNYTQRTKKADFEIDFEHKLIEITNPPGEINREAWLIIKNELLYLKKNPLNNTKKTLKKDSSQKRNISVIVITGEEDLLALPTILEAPKGSFVLYGQPPMIGDGSSGIVLIEISEEIQVKVETLLSKFDQI